MQCKECLPFGLKTIEATGIMLGVMDLWMVHSSLMGGAELSALISWVELNCPLFSLMGGLELSALNLIG